MLYTMTVMSGDMTPYSLVHHKNTTYHIGDDHCLSIHCFEDFKSQRHTELVSAILTIVIYQFFNFFFLLAWQVWASYDETMEHWALVSLKFWVRSTDISLATFQPYIMYPVLSHDREIPLYCFL